MAEVSVSLEIEASADDLYAFLADFGEVGWMQGVTRVEVDGSGVGMRRAIYAGGDTAVLEVLESLDPERRKVGYAIPENNPMPVDDYHAVCTAEDLGNGRSRLVWACTYEPKGVDEATAKATVEGMYGVLTGWVKAGIEGR